LYIFQILARAIVIIIPKAERKADTAFGTKMTTVIAQTTMITLEKVVLTVFLMTMVIVLPDQEVEVEVKLEVVAVGLLVEAVVILVVREAVAVVVIQKEVPVAV